MPQATGGLFTDWESVPNYANLGFPVVEVHDDGHLFLSKPPKTGGLVTEATVAEQLLYEIGDPARGRFDETPFRPKLFGSNLYPPILDKFPSKNSSYKNLSEYYWTLLDNNHGFQGI
jgi:hypothetical protein